jgi:IclR family transcriptional regulator, acetate operon repressor
VAVPRLSTVEKAFRVLGVVAEQQPIGMAALTRATGLDKSAVQRIVATLQHVGWLQPATRASGWELAPEALVVGRRAASGFVARARPHLEALAADTSETVALWVLDGDRFVCVDAIESGQQLRVVIAAGMVVPVTDAGEFLAFVPADRRPRLGGALTDALTDALDDDEVAAIVARGYYLVADAEGTHAVGVPVRDGEGEAIGAVTVVAPVSRTSARDTARLGRRTIDAAVRISASG